MDGQEYVFKALEIASLAYIIVWLFGLGFVIGTKLQRPNF